jgi:hypothetical protein
VPETLKPGRLCNGMKPTTLQTYEVAKFCWGCLVFDRRTGTVWVTRRVDGQT